jgi:beta-glucosidase
MKTTLFLFVLLLAATHLPVAAQRGPESASTPFLKSSPDRPAKLTRAPGDYDLLLIGDSITRRWNRGNAVKKQFSPWKVLALGHEGERTENILYRLQNGELEGVRAKVVMILIGTNNIGHTRDQPEWIAAGVKEIVATVRARIPGARVLVMGIFPRGFEPMNPKTGKPNPARTRIAATNQLLAGLADGNSIAFLDIGSEFLDSQGMLSKEIFPDALHPSSKGYQIWYQLALPKLTELMKSR